MVSSEAIIQVPEFIQDMALISKLSRIVPSTFKEVARVALMLSIVIIVISVLIDSKLGINDSCVKRISKAIGIVDL